MPSWLHCQATSLGQPCQSTESHTLLQLCYSLENSGLLQEDAGWVEQRMLEELLTKKCPRVRAAAAQSRLDLEDLTTTWFPCLFACTLPAETTARVWDCLLCEGPKILFRVALALFKVILLDPAAAHMAASSRQSLPPVNGIFVICDFCLPSCLVNERLLVPSIAYAHLATVMSGTSFLLYQQCLSTSSSGCSQMRRP